MSNFTKEEILKKIWERQSYNPGIKKDVIAYFIDKDLTQVQNQRTELKD